MKKQEAKKQEAKMSVMGSRIEHSFTRFAMRLALCALRSMTIDQHKSP